MCIARQFARVLLLTGFACEFLTAADNSFQWLQFAGEDLEIVLPGELVDADGRPADGFEVTVALNTGGTGWPLTADVVGNRFEIRIPVNRIPWYSMWLRAVSADGERVAYAKLGAYELRQTASDGLKLVLKRPTRDVVVKVISEGRSVPNAHVQAEIGYGIKLDATTDARGFAHLGLLPDQELTRLSAWTDDFRVGGYSFDRKPSRDPNLEEHVVELSKCRDQRLHFIDENGNPVPGVEFDFYVATPPPDINYLIISELTHMTTDGFGEAVYNWFPDWRAHHFYPELKHGAWVLPDEHPQRINGTYVYTLKPARSRKRVLGRISSVDTSVGGFHVTLRSFQGERESYSDLITTFANADGSFEVDVLPGATYCAYVTDVRWAGEIVDVLPVATDSEETTPIELNVSRGHKVEVIVTTGAEKKPYPNLSVSFRKDHRYSWLEDGKEQSGIGGPQWWATTNEQGKAYTRVLPGELRVSIYTPFWRTDETINVGEDEEKVRVVLHREFESKRTISGRLVLAEGLDASLKDAQIELGSIDGQYDERESITCSADGTFSFQTMSSEIGFYAETQGGKAAGTLIAKDLDEAVEITLYPTQEFFGFAMAKDNQPLPNNRVYAEVRVVGSERADEGFAASFTAKRLTAQTDDNGTYVLRGVPRETKLSVYAEPEGELGEPTFLETVFLRTGN